MKYTIKNQHFWLLFALCSLTLIPFLGLPQFYEDGEAKEAVVSYSMLVDDDWTLPRNNGGDISYRPPFFHWCVAIVSIIRGDMTEGATRIPSAVALIAMTLWMFGFLSRRKGVMTGLLASLIAFTTYELHSAAINCWVDMMLTATMVMSIYLFYRWYEQDMQDHGTFVLTALAMGAATLTKGPVGTLLPSLIMGIFILLRGERTIKSLAWLVLAALLSFVPYALWFYAAWLEGGQDFLDVVYNENIGRMTGTTDYGMYIHPWYYNVLSLVKGFMPWTLMLLLSLTALHYKKPTISLKVWWRQLTAWLRGGDSLELLSLTAIVVTIVFYCIPFTKRGVYLMPAYPFIAYFIAKYIIWMAANARKVMKLYGATLSVLSIVLFVAFLLLKTSFASDMLDGQDMSSENVLTLIALSRVGLWWQWVLILTPTMFGLYWWIRHKEDDMHNVYAVLFLTFGLHIAFDGVYMPIRKNVLSVRTTSILINHAAPAAEGIMYEYKNEETVGDGSPKHFYEVNFYLRNRIRNFRREQPASGFLLISRADAEQSLKAFQKEGYQFSLHFDPKKRDMLVYKFSKSGGQQ